MFTPIKSESHETLRQWEWLVNDKKYAEKGYVFIFKKNRELKKEEAIKYILYKMFTIYCKECKR